MKRVHRVQPRQSLLLVGKKKSLSQAGLATQTQCNSGQCNGKCNSNNASIGFTRAISKSAAR
jgi:hypothetical protein